MLPPERHPSATRLWLVRHTAPAVEANRCYGSLDVGLSEQGREEAVLLADAFGDSRLAAVYSSPLLRARETAAEIAVRHALTVRELPGLAEIDFGEFEGRSYDEIATSHPDVYATWMREPSAVEFPGGERFGAFADRVHRCADEIRRAHDGEEAVVVSHGGPIRIVIAAALAMPARELFRLDLSLGGLCAIDWVDERPLVRLLNAGVRTVRPG